MTVESPQRKVSRSSTNQLIADVANGLAAHIDGPDPPNGGAGGGGVAIANSAGGGHMIITSSSLVAVETNSPGSPASYRNAIANNNMASVVDEVALDEIDENHPGRQQQLHQNKMSSFRPPHPGNHLPLPPACTSESGRSAGDGGSTIEDENNYASVKNLCDEDLELMDEEDDSHYSLIRKPDGRADESPYSTLRENPRIPPTMEPAASASEDGGYESLHSHQQQHRQQVAGRQEPGYAGIESRKLLLITIWS